MPTAWSNIDFLAWFSDDERRNCASCGKRTAVGFPEADSVFCLSCGAVWLHGDRVDVDLRIPVEAVADDLRREVRRVNQHSEATSDLPSEAAS